ncbi:MAG: hypothetical protein KN64_14860 [Sulfurovum sp. AS07-7]|nr:MAG: hypothetical protein KN64_14860 [Sulfurovum sp. AS07-7]
MLLLWRNKYKTKQKNKQKQLVLNDEPFFYTLYSLQNGGGAVFLDLGFRSQYATTYNTCDNFVFRVLPNRKIEVFTIEGGFRTFDIESFVSVSGYAKHIFASLSDGSVGIYTQDGVLKGKVEGTEGLPRFYWKNKYFFKYYKDNKVGTLIFDTEFKPFPRDILKYLPSNIKPPSQTTIKENSVWHTKSVLGLYDFYGLGTYKNTRYKYALRKYGNFLPDTPFKTPVKAFDQYGDFHSVLSGDKKDIICHTYDNIHFTFFGAKFTLPTKANRFLFGKDGGFFGKIFLERTNDTYRIKTELFRLTKGEKK